MTTEFYVPTLDDVYEGLRKYYPTFPTISPSIPIEWDEFVMSASEWFDMIRKYGPWSEEEKAWIIEGLTLKWGM